MFKLLLLLLSVCGSLNGFKPGFSFDLQKTEANARACIREVANGSGSLAEKVIKIIRSNLPKRGEPSDEQLEKMQIEAFKVFPNKATFKAFNQCMNRKLGSVNQRDL